MQGSLLIGIDEYLFRNDHCHGSDIWAWKIEDINNGSDRIKTYKWSKIPKNATNINLFDIDNPPNTVKYR